MNGFVLTDKKKGVTSFDEVKRIRRLFKEKTVGHVGTLDPFADGVLILALGRYTKLFFLFDDLDKEYVVTGVFGETRDTDDIDGQVIKISDKKYTPSKEEIEALLVQKFTGSVMQKPPLYSAKKIDGKRAYDLARNGISFETKTVNVFIHSIKLLSYEYPKFSLKISVSKGTYIRSIVRDIGQYFLLGAYAKTLSRTRIGGITLDDIKKHGENILTFKEVFPSIAQIKIECEKQKKMILNGDRRFFEQFDKPVFLKEKYIALFDNEDTLLSLVDSAERKYVYVDVK